MSHCFWDPHALSYIRGPRALLSFLYTSASDNTKQSFTVKKKKKQKENLRVERKREIDARARFEERAIKETPLQRAMETSDVEMEAAESAPDNAATGGASRPMESAWGLLSRARQLLAEGHPTFALQSVLSAIRSQGGEPAVLRALSRARELYQQQEQSESDLGQLTTLLAQCAIEDASVSGSTGSSNPYCGPGQDPCELLSSPDAILAESGRDQVILDAFNDGSSFICVKCKGLFSMSRKDEHLANWCQ